MSVTLWLAWVFVASAPVGEAPKTLVALPSRVQLSGPSALQRFVVIGTFEDGSTRDVTPRVTFAAADPKIVSLDASHIVRPISDGETTIVARLGAVEVKVPVEVKRAHAERLVSFRNEVVPVLTKLGCNQGACHGRRIGKGGFKLSLLGFEPAPDHTAIVKSAEGRRVTPFAPEESLLLSKPTLEVAHAGGKKLEVGTPEYDLLKLWLEQGAPGPVDADPSVQAIAVFPSSRIARPEEEQRLVVLATMSDGTTRDVTAEAKFDTLNEGVAKVNAAGLATTVGQGETTILVRYQGRAALARLTVPYGPSKAFELEAGKCCG